MPYIKKRDAAPLVLSVCKRESTECDLRKRGIIGTVDVGNAISIGSIKCVGCSETHIARIRIDGCSYTCDINGTQVNGTSITASALMVAVILVPLTWVPLMSVLTRLMVLLFLSRTKISDWPLVSFPAPRRSVANDSKAI